MRPGGFFVPYKNPEDKKRRAREREQAAKLVRQQWRKEASWKELHGDLYRHRPPKKLTFSETARNRRIALRQQRLAELRATTKGRFGNLRICKSPTHIGDERRIPDELFDKKTYLCVACASRERHQAKAFEYLKKVNMARDKLLNAIVEGKLGVGTLKDFYHAGLKAFGGIEGLVTCIRAEYDAADPGSQIRKQYLEMIVKVMVALSTMGHDEDVEMLPDEEVARRVLEMRQEAAKLAD